MVHLLTFFKVRSARLFIQSGLGFWPSHWAEFIAGHGFAVNASTLFRLKKCDTVKTYSLENNRKDSRAHDHGRDRERVRQDFTLVGVGYSSTY